MNNPVVRLIDIELHNFKNVEYGDIKFCNYKSATKKGIIDSTDLMAIYGQNGSGKTALVEAFQIIKSIMSGKALPKDKIHLLSVEHTTRMRLEFLMVDTNTYKVQYEFSVFVEDEENAFISSELLELRTFDFSTEKWSKVKKIQFSHNADSVPIFPKASLNQNQKIDLTVTSRYAKKEGTSFLFLGDTINLLKDIKYDYIPSDILSNLKNYAIMNLFLVTVEQLGLVNLSNLIPLYFQVEDDDKIRSGDIAINLFDVSVVRLPYYDLIVNIKEQINLVLKAIIPGLEIDLESYGKEKTSSGELGERIEFVALRYGLKFPLKHESEGIKRIISILSTLIAVYSKENVCLIVDEFDSGVYEYLLGQLLEVLNTSAEGQLIFTSHNLRALEVLPKEKIIFSTSNPKNRFVSIKGVGSSHNLRDFYLRTVLLGGQDETIYEDTHLLDLKRAFRKAGRTDYGKS